MRDRDLAANRDVTNVKTIFFSGEKFESEFCFE